MSELDDDFGFKQRKKKGKKASGLVSAPIKLIAKQEKEEEEETIVFTKIKRNDLVHHDALLSKVPPQKTGLSYDLDSLKKNQQLINKHEKARTVSLMEESVGNGLHENLEERDEGADLAFIPSKDQIEQARRMREKKRLKLTTNEDEDEDGAEDKHTSGFIPLDETAVSTFKNITESRFVTEEQDDGEETFEDYSGTALAFGARAVKDAQENARREKLELINGIDNEDEEEDEQFRDWEMQHIHDGQRSELVKSTRPSAFMMSEDAIVALKIPNTATLLGDAEILSEINTAIENLKVSIEQSQNHIDICKKDSESSETSLVKLNEELEAASTRYEYFQGLNSYIVDLVDFLDAKESVIESLETSFVDSLMNALINDSNVRRQNLKAALSQFLASDSDTGSNAMMDQLMDVKNEEELLLEKDSCFDDASKYFKKLHHVKERLDKWKLDYPKEYEQGYGAMNMAGIFDIYVRHELLDWSPFTNFKAFEEMQWHEQLVDFGVEDSAITNPDDPDSQLLKNIIEKTCIPRFQVLISTFDLFSREKNGNALEYMRSFQDYSSLKSSAMQNLFDSIEDHIIMQLDSEMELCSAFSPSIASADTELQIAAKQTWISSGFTLFENLLQWKRYLGAATTKRLLLEKVIEGLLLPALESCFHLITDLEGYSKISDLIKDFVPDVYQTPAELKFLEVSFLKHIHIKVEKTPALQSIQSYTRILHVLNNLKSFQACSLVAKKLQELQ